jgi:acetyl-CoA synthetase
VHDIEYRFKKLMPAVVITDAENAEKIDEAEKLSGKTVRLKIIIGAARNGWLSFDDIFKESGRAKAADTNADDPLFLFFTLAQRVCLR